MGSRAESVKQYKKSEIKWKKELKARKKKNKILFRIANKFGSHRELKNIKKIGPKSAKKRHDDRSDSSSDELDSDSSLSTNGD